MGRNALGRSHPTPPHPSPTKMTTEAQRGEVIGVGDLSMVVEDRAEEGAGGE